MTRRRLAYAAARAECGKPSTFAEYDVFYGLTGRRAALRHHPGSDELAGILRYVVTLTRLRHDGGDELLGWWVAHDPDEILPARVDTRTSAWPTARPGCCPSSR